MTVIEPSSGAPTRRVPTSDKAELRLAGERRSVLQHLKDIWVYRELLKQLIRRELSVKYKKSVLGFLWSLLNPLFILFIYYLVFQVFLGSGIRAFPIWLLSGLLVWSLFSNALTAGTGSITNNAYLVGKVRFPREILPLAAVGAGFIDFLFQTAALGIFLVIFQWAPAWGYLWMLIPAMVALILLAAGLGILLGATNVYARDTQHLLGLVITAWFWLTPILISYKQISGRLAERGIPEWVLMLNPVTPIVMTFQRAVYGHTTSTINDTTTTLLPDVSQWIYARNLGVILLLSVVVFWGAIRVFDRAEGNFAEIM
jgi:ABC-2 type transport system permease protein